MVDRLGTLGFIGRRKKRSRRVLCRSRRSPPTTASIRKAFTLLPTTTSRDRVHGLAVILRWGLCARLKYIFAHVSCAVYDASNVRVEYGIQSGGRHSPREVKPRKYLGRNLLVLDDGWANCEPKDTAQATRTRTCAKSSARDSSATDPAMLRRRGCGESPMAGRVGAAVASLGVSGPEAPGRVVSAALRRRIGRLKPPIRGGGGADWIGDGVPSLRRPASLSAADDVRLKPPCRSGDGWDTFSSEKDKRQCTCLR